MLLIALLLPIAAAVASTSVDPRLEELKRHVTNASREAGGGYMNGTGFRVEGTLLNLDVDYVNEEALMSGTAAAESTITFTYDYINPHLRWNPSEWKNVTEIELDTCEELTGPAIHYHDRLPASEMRNETNVHCTVFFDGRVRTASNVSTVNFCDKIDAPHTSIPYDQYSCRIAMSIDWIGGLDVAVRGGIEVQAPTGWLGSGNIRATSTHAAQRTSHLPLRNWEGTFTYSISRDLALYEGKQQQRNLAISLSVTAFVVILIVALIIYCNRRMMRSMAMILLLVGAVAVAELETSSGPEATTTQLAEPRSEYLKLQQAFRDLGLFDWKYGLSRTQQRIDHLAIVMVALCFGLVLLSFVVLVLAIHLANKKRRQDNEDKWAVIKGKL